MTIDDFKINTYFVDEFSKEIYEQTYKWGEEDINSTQFRVAKSIASIEKDPFKWTGEFLWALENFKFSPGGRITSNAGTKLGGTSMINCFTPEVEVLTKKGYIQIKDIKVNDEVLTHTGKWRKVKSTMNRIYQGDLDVYNSSVLTGTIKSTPDHPFYQGNGEWKNSEINNKLVLLSINDNNDDFYNIDILEYVKDIKRIDGGNSELYYDDNILNTTSSFLHKNSNITTKDSLSINRKIKLTENVAYSFGRFVGDGSTFTVNGRYDVDGFNIIFSQKERSELIFIKESLENAFGIDININESADFDGVYLRKNNIILGEFFKSAFGRDAYSKKIPKFIWESPKNIIESFLLGIFDADGTFTKSKELRIVLSNNKLIKDIQALMNMIGFPGRISETSMGEFKSWKLYINKNIGNNFILKLKKHYNDDRFNYKITNNGLSPIIDESSSTEKIYLVKNFVKTKEYYEGLVYNISVNIDESYVVNNVVVHNCFVDGFLGEDQDSMEGILDALRRQALILKSEGGYGFCADVMRPRGAFIRGIGNESPGAVKMLDMWDTQSAVITEGSGQKTKRTDAKIKIRKGAQMVTMSCHHPDIEEFITAKQTPGRLTKFNMSVLITDEFMNAVGNNLTWDLEFPDYEKHSEEYKKSWNGNLKIWKERGLTTKIYKTYEKASELWNIIMQSTFNRNEPGVLFIDTINKFNNLRYCEYINATNPCGEQTLPIGGVCLLGSINLTQFVDWENKNWDYDKLERLIPIAIRFMDNVNDITYVPLDIQMENLKNKRRIGLGIMGYGSALMMLKLKYGSEEALKLTNELMDFIANKSYQSSALLAKEKGKFPLFTKEYLDSNYIKNTLNVETISLIKENGIRNSHLLSIQPTGNSGIFSNNVSGGLEPIFMSEYIRTSIMPFSPDGLDTPKNIDWDNKKYTSDTEWIWSKEGDENILTTSFNGYTWKFDRSRGLLRETIVKDYAVRFLENIGEWDTSADWASTTSNLTIDEHVKTMEIFAKYIDSAISKTINIPNEYSYDDFKSLYEKLYNTGVIKGGTSYRAGTMLSVLSEVGSSKSKDDYITKTDAPKRPKTLECNINQLTVAGEKWIVIVGLLGKDPYEVFAFKKKSINISEKIKLGKLTKIKRGRYDLELDGFTLENIKEHFESGEQESLTRLISTSLRHGADINFIYEQLIKAEGNVASFSKAIARTLKSYINVDKINLDVCECGGKISMQEGCFVCLNCGKSKCQ